MDVNDPNDAGNAVYVHWPFCEAKCPYCDFNSHVWTSIDQPDWAAAYELDLARQFSEFPIGPVTSVYFGGGTPSLMRPDSVHRIPEQYR